LEHSSGKNVKITSHGLIEINVEGKTLNLLCGELMTLKETKLRLVAELHKVEESVENLLKEVGVWAFKHLIVIYISF